MAFNDIFYDFATSYRPIQLIASRDVLFCFSFVLFINQFNFSFCFGMPLTQSIKCLYQFTLRLFYTSAVRLKRKYTQINLNNVISMYYEILLHEKTERRSKPWCKYSLCITQWGIIAVENMKIRVFRLCRIFCTSYLGLVTHTHKQHSKPKIFSVHRRLIRQTSFFFCRFLTENYFLSSNQIKYKLLDLLLIGCIVFTQSSNCVNITWFVWSVTDRQHIEEILSTKYTEAFMGYFLRIN